jgi:hypothetical protein
MSLYFLFVHLMIELKYVGTCAGSILDWNILNMKFEYLMRYECINYELFVVDLES